MLTKKQIESKGFRVSFTNGTGAGGQKRNRTYSVAVVEHIESGLRNRNDSTRNSTRNMNKAYEILVLQLSNKKFSEELEKRNRLRKQTISKGVIRNYNYKTGRVTDSRSKVEADLKKIMNGNLDLLR